jgi:hypothetical protein
MQPGQAERYDKLLRGSGQEGQTAAPGGSDAGNAEKKKRQPYLERRSMVKKNIGTIAERKVVNTASNARVRAISLSMIIHRKVWRLSWAEAKQQ